MKVLGFSILLIFLVPHVSFAQAPSTDSNSKASRTRQISSQVDRLAGAIKDEYANEAPHGRVIRFVDVPGLGTLVSQRLSSRGLQAATTYTNIWRFSALLITVVLRRTGRTLPFRRLQRLATDALSMCAQPTSRRCGQISRSLLHFRHTSPS
jgi:hypothetical protein